MSLSRCAHCGAVAHINKSVTDPHLCWSVQCSNLDCGMTTRAFSQQQQAVDAWQRCAGNEIVLDFYNRVCDRAEANMALTGTVSGAHWNAMRQELAALGVEVKR